MAEANVFSAPGVPQTARLPGLSRSGGVALARDVVGIADANMQASNQNRDASERVRAIDHETAMLEQEQLDLRETSNAMRQLSELGQAAEQYFGEVKMSAGPGGEGVAIGVAQHVDDGVQRIQDSITSPRVLQKLAPALASAKGIKVEAMLYERAAAVTRSIADTSTALDVGDNVMRVKGERGAAIEVLDQDLTQLVETIDALPAADDVKQKLLRERIPGRLQSYWAGVNARDPAAAEQLLSDPRFSVIDADRAAQMAETSRAAIRRNEAAARAEAAAAVAAAKDEMGALEVDLNKGAGTYDDRVAMAERYAALGDQSKAAEWRAKANEFSAVQKARDWTLPQMQGEIARLTAKQGAGGLTGTEAALLGGLKNQATASEERLKGAGGAIQQYAYATGKPLPAIDLARPETLRARAQVASAAAAKYGLYRVEPLTEAEVTPLRQMADGGPGERMQALRTLSGFGDARAITGAARQISGPDDGGFRIAATFLTAPGGETLARDILRGPDALRANAKVYDPLQAKTVFNEYVGGALAGMPPDYAADTLEAAKNLYASRMTQRGLTTWSEPEWRGAIEASMGAVVQGGYTKGGTAKFKSQRVMIPSGWTGDGVFRRIARITGEDLGKARVSGAGQWPDGSPIYTGQLRELVPVYVGGTSYSFKSPDTGRLLGAEGGGPFVLDMAKVPWR